MESLQYYIDKEKEYVMSRKETKDIINNQLICAKEDFRNHNLSIYNTQKQITSLENKLREHIIKRNEYDRLITHLNKILTQL